MLEPANYPRRISSCEAHRRNVLGDHTSGANHSSSSDGHALQDDTAWGDPYVGFDDNRRYPNSIPALEPIDPVRYIVTARFHLKGMPIIIRDITTFTNQHIISDFDPLRRNHHRAGCNKTPVPDPDAGIREPGCKVTPDSILPADVDATVTLEIKVHQRDRGPPAKGERSICQTGTDVFFPRDPEITNTLDDALEHIEIN
jgi:hypothetical protein